MILYLNDVILYFQDVSVSNVLGEVKAEFKQLLHTKSKRNIDVNHVDIGSLVKQILKTQVNFHFYLHFKVPVHQNVVFFCEIRKPISDVTIFYKDLTEFNNKGK